MTATIAKNHTRKIAALKAELTRCKVYTLANNFHGDPVDPAYAWQALQTSLRATLTVNEAGDTWTVSVHSNCWYQLRKAP
jgi:hypothetical protein